ncbi:MAG: hypothetical protein ABJA74_15830 [Lapillicoccus sp.]
MTTDPFVAAYGEAEGDRFVEAFGNHYEVARKVAAMPMLKFSKLAAKGMQTGDMEAGAAMYDVLRAMFTRDAWARFEDDATEAGVDNDELFKVVADAVQVINGFPTSPSSDSSPGPSSVTPSSTVSSFAERKRALGMVPVTPEAIAELVG